MPNLRPKRPFGKTDRNKKNGKGHSHGIDKTRWITQQNQKSESGKKHLGRQKVDEVGDRDKG